MKKSIEEKLQQFTDLGVKIAEMNNDVGDKIEAVPEDKSFSADLEKGCSQKKKEWDERMKTRALKIAAMTDTIKILNDDDALELFKKTPPSASSSLMQVTMTSASMKAAVISLLRRARNASSLDRSRLDVYFIGATGQ